MCRCVCRYFCFPLELKHELLTVSGFRGAQYCGTANLRMHELHHTWWWAQAWLMLPHVNAHTVAERLRAAGRLPTVGHGLDSWIAPEVCMLDALPPSLQANPHDPVPGFFSRDIGLVMSRHAYRGFASLGSLYFSDKDAVEFTDSAHLQQAAIIRAIVARTIRPLEALGFRVRVFLHVHAPPSSSYGATSAWARSGAWKEDLIAGFNANSPNAWPRVVESVVSSTSRSSLSRDQGQAESMAQVFKLVDNHIRTTGVQFRALLVQRYDMVPPHSLGPAGADNAFGLGNETTRLRLGKALASYDEAPTRSLTNGYSPERYTLWAATVWGSGVPSHTGASISIPGWALGCVLGLVLH